MAVNGNFIKAKTRGLDAGDGIGLLGKTKLVSAKALQSVLPAKVMVHEYMFFSLQPFALVTLPHLSIRV